VELYYSIRDLEGNDIVFAQETLAVHDEKILNIRLKIPEYLKSGQYVFYAEARYNGKIAVSASIIEVIEPGEIGAGYLGFKSRLLLQLKNIALSTWIFVIIILLAITYYGFGTEINKKFGQISRYGQREIKRPHAVIIPGITKPRLIERKKRIFVKKEKELFEREKGLRQKERALARKKINLAEQLEKGRLLKQLNEWKTKGYDTTLIEAELKDKFNSKHKLKSTEYLEKEKLIYKLQEWKAKGYDITLLETELKESSNTKKHKQGSIKNEINNLSKKIEEWKSKGYDTSLLDKEIEELENK